MNVHDATPQFYYQIRVEGRLDEGWTVWFEGLKVAVDASEDDGPTTTSIAGPVLDQAALYGLLSRVRDMGLRLVSVNRIPPNQDSDVDER